jgi:hypothetical protein
MLKWTLIVFGCLTAALFAIMSFIWYVSGWTLDPVTRETVPTERDTPAAVFAIMGALAVLTAVFWVLAGYVGRWRKKKRAGST